jgi:cytochrome c-type biogenesis protein CcmH
MTALVSAVLIFPLLAEELSPELEKEAKAIEGLLIAPCCWRQPVAVHYSPAADEVRSEIRQMLAAGLTREEILKRFVEKYGDKILAKPPAEGFNLLAYFLPVLFLAFGAVVAVAVVKRLRPVQKKSDSDGERKKTEPDPSYDDRIEKELWG